MLDWLKDLDSFLLPLIAGSIGAMAKWIWPLIFEAAAAYNKSLLQRLRAKREREERLTSWLSNNPDVYSDHLSHLDHEITQGSIVLGFIALAAGAAGAYVDDLSTTTQIWIWIVVLLAVAIPTYKLISTVQRYRRLRLSVYRIRSWPNVDAKIWSFEAQDWVYLDDDPRFPPTLRYYTRLNDDFPNLADQEQPSTSPGDYGQDQSGH